MKKIVKKLGIFLLAFSLMTTCVYAAPSLKDEKKDAQAELASLEKQLAATMSEIYDLDEQIIVLGKEIRQANEDLAEAEEKEKKQHAAMKCRIVAMYENGSSSLWEMIFESGSFADMLKAAENVQTMHEYDRKELQEYINTKEKITNLKASLENEQKQIQAVYEKQEAEVQKIQKMVTEQKAEVADIEERIAKAEAEAARKAAEAARKAAEEAAKRAEEEAKRREEEANKNNGNNSNNSSNSASSGNASVGQKIVNYAKQYLGVPYVWGGTTPSGFDCSGLIMYAHSQAGISIPRTSHAQFAGGKIVATGDVHTAIKKALPGDILYYSDSAGNGHVTLYIGNGQVIHAPTRGSVVKIVNYQNGSKKPFKGIVRYW